MKKSSQADVNDLLQQLSISCPYSFVIFLPNSGPSAPGGLGTNISSFGFSVSEEWERGEEIWEKSSLGARLFFISIQHLGNSI